MNVNFLIADFERKSQTLRHCFFHALCKYNFKLNVSLPQSESNTWARQVYPGCQRHPFVLYGPWERSVDGAMRFPNHRHIIQEIIFLITKRQESFIVYNSSKLSLNCLSGTLKVFVFVKIYSWKQTYLNSRSHLRKIPSYKHRDKSHRCCSSQPSDGTQRNSADTRLHLLNKQKTKAFWFNSGSWQCRGDPMWMWMLCTITIIAPFRTFNFYGIIDNYISIRLGMVSEMAVSTKFVLVSR